MKFGDCLSPQRATCAFALAYGDGTLCFRPDWRDFMEKTKR